MLIGRFGNLFTIIPTVEFTKADEKRGYSDTTTIKIFGKNMKTVQTLILETYRESDLPNNHNGISA